MRVCCDVNAKLTRPGDEHALARVSDVTETSSCARLRYRLHQNRPATRRLKAALRGGTRAGMDSESQ